MIKFRSKITVRYIENSELIKINRIVQSETFPPCDFFLNFEVFISGTFGYNLSLFIIFNLVSKLGDIFGTEVAFYF